MYIWWIFAAIPLMLLAGIAVLLIRYRGNVKNLYRELMRTQKVLVVTIFILISALFGISLWAFISSRQSLTSVNRYEKYFIEEVLPSARVNDLLSLDVFVKKVEKHEVAEIYRQFRPSESLTIIMYYIKFRGEDGYHLAYVPSNFFVFVEMGLGGTQMTLDTYLAQQEEIPVYVITTNPSAPTSPAFFIVSSLLLVALIVLLWFYMRQIGGGFLKAKTRAIQSKVTFADVGGIDEAKEEVAEVVRVLIDPKPYLELNARVPKGTLLHGPPGGGKTLLARAVAGEAGVHSEMISGSEFHEMFVGVGASRARNLFRRAEKYAPSVVIIDELDSAAPKRSGGLHNIHPEAVSLVNQLLSLLDRLEKENIPVFVIGITNRPDMLDPALLRPGRFDRHIEVPLPSSEGRKMILKIHLTRPMVRPIDFNLDADLEVLVKETEGFSGAHLAMLANEAAIRAVREKRKIITLEDFRQSIERVLMGPERKFKLNTKETRLIAWHEAGHALTALLLPETDPVHFVTILPRGRSLGYTRLLPETEYRVVSQERIFNQIKVLMGGRAAEEVNLQERSNGASADLEMATSIARTAVCAYGMSKLGPIRINDPINEAYAVRLWSEKMLEEVDGEVKRILNNCYKDSKDILEKNRGKLDILANVLLEKKRLIKEEIDALIK